MEHPNLPLQPADSPLCAECSNTTGGCCRTDPSQVDYCFPLSAPELARLLPHASLAVEYDRAASAEASVSALVENSPAFLKAIKGLFPQHRQKIETIFPATDAQGGPAFHHRIKTLPSGVCVFLGDQGCRLPRQARPWYCLIFPAWVIQQALTFFVTDICLAAQRASTPAEGTALVGMTPAGVFALFRRMMNDLGIEHSPE